MNTAIDGALKWILNALTMDITTGIWDLFTGLFLSPMSIFQDQDVMQVQVFMTTLALVMLPTLIVIQVLRMSAARAYGVNTMPPEQLVHRAIVAGLACTSISTIVWVIITFGNLVTEAFAKAGLDLSLLKIMMMPGSASMGLLLMAIFMIIAAILLTIQKAIISAELAAMLAFGPISGLSLLKDSESGFFHTWLRETASLILTPIFQLILTWLFLRKLVTWGDLTMSWEARMLTFGYFWVIWKTPSWLRQFAYSGGHGDLLMQGAASATRFMVMRKMFAASGRAVTPGR